MDQKRTQEASETNFTTRGGRLDATSGTGKPHPSPCKRGPEIPDEAGTVGEQTWPDNPRPDDYRVRRVCGAGAVVTFPRIGPADAERKEPQYKRSMMRSCGESPRGVLKRLKKKLSEMLEPAALESLPRLVGALPTSEYLHDIIDEIDEAHYQSELKYFKSHSPNRDPDPEEEEYWRHETKHSIS